MNSRSSADKSHTEQWLKGWAFSVMFHAFVVVAAVATIPKMTLIQQKEPFTWDVTLVDGPRHESAPEATPIHARTPKPTTPKAQPTPPLPVETYQPIARQDESRPVVETVQREVRQDVETVQPLQEIAKVETPSSVVVSKPDAAAFEKPTEAAVVAKAEAAVVEPPAPTTATAITSSPPPQITHQPEVTQSTQSLVTANVSADPVLRQTTGDLHDTVAPAIQAPDPQVALAAKADHTWLGEILYRRIFELKQYPSVARMNGWQGKVVLKVIIKEDGHLEDVTVVNSSGFESLDRAAVEAVRRACPLKMKHQLGRPTVAFRVPVSFTLAS